MQLIFRTIADLTLGYCCSSFFAGAIFGGWFSLTENPLTLETIIYLPQLFLAMLITGLFGIGFGWYVAFPSLIAGFLVTLFLNHQQRKDMLAWTLSGVLIGLINYQFIFPFMLSLTKILYFASSGLVAGLKYMAVKNLF